jgi:hemoglobin
MAAILPSEPQTHQAGVRAAVTFFRGVSMSRLQNLQVDFFCSVLGGDASVYKGRDMRESHAHLPIANEHFDAVAVHLIEALRGAGVPQDKIDAIVAKIAPLRAHIVTTPRLARA